jgi:hypothetical protein
MYIYYREEEQAGRIEERAVSEGWSERYAILRRK